MSSDNETQHEAELLVDRHFEGTISPAEERTMREHIALCNSCRAHYRKRLLLSQLVPDSLSAEDRLARGLGFSTTVEQANREASPVSITERLRSKAPLIVSALALAAILFLVLRSPKKPEDDGFTARGSSPSSIAPSASAKLNVYRVPKGGSPTLLSFASDAQPSPIARTDELAFSYQAPPGATHLMVFGVDERGRVFWFHPAWSNEADNPTAVKIEEDQKPHELREAIRHQLDGERLEIHGLFLDKPLTVREAEKAIAQRGSEFGPITVPAGVDQVILLGVSR